MPYPTLDLRRMKDDVPSHRGTTWPATRNLNKPGLTIKRLFDMND